MWIIQALEIKDESGQGIGTYRLTARSDDPNHGPFPLCSCPAGHASFSLAEQCLEAIVNKAEYAGADPEWIQETIWIYLDGVKLAVMNLDDLKRDKAIKGFDSGRIDVYYTVGDEDPEPLAKDMVTKKTVFINASQQEVTANELTFEDIVALAFGKCPEEIGYPSVIFEKGFGLKPQGIMSKGQVVPVVDGMRFSAIFTDNA